MKHVLGIFLFLLAITSQAQNLTVTGTVTGESDGLPIPGVSVLIKGTTNGTITNIDGKYSIQAVTGETLQVSFIGMQTQEIIVNSSTINVTLGADVTDIDEVVVVGYGVQKKSVVTAAISSVSAEDLDLTNPARVEDVLKGRVSGVQITQSSGQPGADSKVRIRGVGTINNSEPLYIVDGMAVGGGINYLNPSDIESVEILKDAASAAIYGARAANGVVLVTTKSGKKGKATISYDFSYGMQNPWNKRDVLNSKEYMTIMNETALNDGNSPMFSTEEIAAAGEGTNWQDETFNKNAPIQNHQVSISGASDKASYFLSFGYFNQEGIIGGDYGRSNYERYSIRTNNTYDVFEEDRKLLKKFRVGVNLGYSRVESTAIETNSEFGSVLGSAVAFSPLVPVYAEDPDAVLAQYPTAVTDKDGRVFSTPPSGFQEIANPVAMLNAPTNTFDNSDKIVATFWGELDIIDNLKFKTSYGADLAFWGSDGYTFPHFLASQGKDITRSDVRSSMNRGYTWQLENTLSYVKTFNEKHNFSALLGQSAQKYTYRTLSGNDFDLLEYDPNKANIDYGTADRDDERVSGGTGGYSAKTLASYFGRLDYNYDERYMLQATVRRDGSSNFGPDNKWAVFPSFSAGWNITNEAFMEDAPQWLNYLKLRASWGRNGNENIGAFSYTSLMSGQQNYYFGAGDSQSLAYGASQARIANPNVLWEESEQLDIGFDARFFDSALTFGFDYFVKNTNGMLMELPIPGYVGLGAPTANVGDMENRGIEFEISYKNNIGDFIYSIGANASLIRNKLIELGNESGEIVYSSNGTAGIGDYVKGENGEVFPYFYGYKTDGILQNQTQADEYNSMYGQSAQPGDVIFQDVNGDGVIDDEDRTKIGQGMPDWTFGINLGAEYKNFDLNMFFQGSVGNDIFDFSQRGDIPNMNRPTWVLDRWTGEGTSNKIPRMTSADYNYNWKSSDLYIKDGSFVRLKNIQLGYSLPKNVLQSIAIQRLRLYVAAENLLTFTNYDGFEPEIASGDYMSIGVDKGIYPQARTFSVGANITF
ncbi:SusC/RagA family TonB-linked outer membrane protein [Saccharicrinis aurantiacus]|uniref:SusC/RagA family TonB-linked outer membrane protein n=1 Tax=Saccharicrinis aurantiacus TaxID=1849719 RepID=UPI00094F59F0|nr:TonB-dependent receptor [Saccharicrinis aurantiacus]